MTISKAARDGWSDFSSNLTWRQRADLLAALSTTNTDSALIAELTTDLHDKHEGLVGDWTILEAAGPLDRAGLLACLVQLEQHMERYPADHEMVTQGLLIALLRSLQPDTELYDQALHTLSVVVESPPT
jgi:hypothetical protein